MNTIDVLSDAEASIIGSLQVYPELFKCLYVSPDHFEPKYKPIITAMLESMKENNALIAEKILRFIGVDANLYLECASIFVSKDKRNFMKLQNFLLEKYKKNRTIYLAKQLSSGNLSLEDYTNEFQKLATLSVKETDKLTIDKLMKSCTDESKVLEFKRFRKLRAGANIAEHDFVILAGLPGTGKTGIALNLMIDLAKTYNVVYFNMEMPETRLHQRLVSLVSEVPMYEIRKYKNLSNENMNKVNQAINTIANGNITITSESQSIESIRAYVAAHESEGHMIVFVDHIGLIKSKNDNPYQRMSQIAIGLRRISLDYNCTIIGLSQLKRIDKKEQAHPSLNMLRDSGEIEQSARKVIFVWERDGDYSLIIEKNDEGPLTAVLIDYTKETQAVYESARTI